MEQDSKNIPHSTKATEFNITLSSGAKENNERVTFLEQQLQQAKEAYKTTLKTVVKECISLEIATAKKEETEIIMDLLPSIGSAIQTLQGIECDKHLQSVNVLAFTPKLLEHCPLTELDSFVLFYQSHHSLDAIPLQTIIPMDDEYPNVESHTAAFQVHAASLQKEENKGIEMYKQCLTWILTIPTLS